MRPTVYNLARGVRSVSPAARVNGTATGSTVDRTLSGGGGANEWHQSAMVVVQTGTITDGSHAVSVEHSDDGAAWSAAPATDLQGSAPTILAADDDRVFEVGYIGNKRYLRVVVVTTGATTGGIFGAVIVLGFPLRAPVVRP